MAVGDRKSTPEIDAYAAYEVTDETIAQGYKQVAMIVKTVDDNGATVTPASGASATLFDGSQATSTTAAALNGAVSQAVSEVIVQNRDAAINLLVGNVTSQSIALVPGAAVVIPVADLASVFVKSASGTPTVAWLGRS